MEFLQIPQHLHNACHSKTFSRTSHDTHWTAPKVSHLKVNTDATWDSSTNSCGIAAVVRDSNGLLVGGSSRFDMASSPLAAEALAIQLGLTLASSLSLSSFQLESDSLVLISAFLNPLSTVDWSASQLVSRIRSQAALFHRVNWHWASRRANRAADLVAALALHRVCIDDWTSNPPPSLMRILLFDAAGPPP
ncbi:uncharacterized protein LOC112169478 [Rosa chinensis]|uniref:uncharacterized protein LOC112169478 n=1 Tax=Rosa chinensis TaxID=74649 RepID=UPI000D08EDE0|nr:uncharacterized protein LOC112169478 [Rosa chinensis]